MQTYASNSEITITNTITTTTIINNNKERNINTRSNEYYAAYKLTIANSNRKMKNDVTVFMCFVTKLTHDFHQFILTNKFLKLNYLNYLKNYSFPVRIDKASSNSKYILQDWGHSVYP